MTRLPDIHYFQTLVDEGEAEAMALYKEMGADLLLIDELYGRKVARSHTMRIRGVLGVLLEAKMASLIPAIKPHLDTLMTHGFYIRPQLYHKMLKDVGESTP